ncbi:hypothetical protein ZWY2020_029274 [Hordeum vulgare]|nr:hypothetical protein ZWY2020_029274 [Hordeum vulgare]
MMHQCSSARCHRAWPGDLLQLGLVRHNGLLLEEKQASPEVEAGLDPQEALAQDNEGRQLQDGIRRQVVRLQVEQVEPVREEGARREPKAPVEVLVEYDDLSLFRCWSCLGARDSHQHLGGRGQHPAVA